MKIPTDQSSPFPLRDRLLRQAEVEAKVGFKKTKIWELVSEGSFPEPIGIGPRAIAWRESEIDTWIATLPRASRQSIGLQKARAARRPYRNQEAYAA